MAARYAQQPQFGTQSQPGYGYQQDEQQSQYSQPAYGQNSQQQQQYGREAYGQEQQEYAQEPKEQDQDGEEQQDQSNAPDQATGQPGSTPRIGAVENKLPNGKLPDAEEPEHELVKQKPEEAGQQPAPAGRQFPQDPHHSNLMAHFHEIAEHGLTDDHIHSMVHVGSFLLANLAKHAGMTQQHHAAKKEREGTATKTAAASKIPAKPAAPKPAAARK